MADNKIKTVRCHYGSLEQNLNRIGREHIISIMSELTHYGEHIFVLVYDTPGLYIEEDRVRSS